MQPYVFPYIGYFAYINATDRFVLYDDVQFIMRGWINRNRIMLNGREHMITVPLVKASPNRKINETPILSDSWASKLLATIRQAYARAPQFETAFPLIEGVFTADDLTIDRLAARSIRAICDHLGVKTQLVTSSSGYGNAHLDRVHRLVDICRQERATTLIVPEGGRGLYERTIFAEAGINLRYLRPIETQYPHGPKDPWIPWLSVIDVIMYLPPSDTRALLDHIHLD